MKQLLFAFALLLFQITRIFAQDGRPFPDMRSWMIGAGDTSERYILADTAFILLSPGTQKKPQDTLTFDILVSNWSRMNPTSVRYI